MKVWNQWRGIKSGNWGISLFTVYYSDWYVGVVILGIYFEWARKRASAGS